MARKTFVSYKYSEAQSVRDDIINALGPDATYYQGETSDSPDLTDTTTQNIKTNLADMIYGTSVTIVVISPNLRDSKWIDWEIKYSLKEISRDGRQSKTNGIIGVIMEYQGGYSWIASTNTSKECCKPRIIDDNKLYDIINRNRFNLKQKEYTCEQCKSVSQLDGSYISLIEEKHFLSNPSKYIDNAYDKAEDIEKFDIEKT